MLRCRRIYIGRNVLPSASYLSHFNNSVSVISSALDNRRNTSIIGFSRPFSNMAIRPVSREPSSPWSPGSTPCCVRGNEKQGHSHFQLVAVRICRQATTRCVGVSNRRMARYNHLWGSATTLSRQQGSQDSCPAGLHLMVPPSLLVSLQ